MEILYNLQRFCRLGCHRWLNPGMILKNLWKYQLLLPEICHYQLKLWKLVARSTILNFEFLFLKSREKKYIAIWKVFYFSDFNVTLGGGWGVLTWREGCTNYFIFLLWNAGIWSYLINKNIRIFVWSFILLPHSAISSNFIQSGWPIEWHYFPNKPSTHPPDDLSLRKHSFYISPSHPSYNPIQ